MWRFIAVESGILPSPCSLTGQIVLPAAQAGGVAGRASKLLLLKHVLFNLRFSDSCIVLNAYLLLLELVRLDAIGEPIGDYSGLRR
jgi:hypothetical protein